MSNSLIATVLYLDIGWAGLSICCTSIMLTVLFPVRPDVQAHLAINCVIGGVVLVIVLARLFARQFMGAGIGLDDLLIVCATVSIRGAMGLSATRTDNG
jgi:hypothetical protein